MSKSSLLAYALLVGAVVASALLTAGCLSLNPRSERRSPSGREFRYATTGDAATPRHAEPQGISSARDTGARTRA